MPRSNRPRRPRGGPSAARTRPAAEVDVGRATAGGRRTETFRGGTWVVRPVSGPGAVKPYRCPGCDQEIPVGMPHVVVWPFDVRTFGDGVADRRHWHSPCWSARERRGRRG